MNRFAILTLLVTINSIQSYTQTISLKIGDLAPPMKVLQWLKGDSISEFKKGNIYLIEFTGSQCVPCRAVAPHLTNLAKKYSNKVIVAGICVGENPFDTSGSTAYVRRVKEFVLKMGNKMGYNVAVDDPVGTMFKTWLVPSGQIGIPCAFLINKDNQIVWIGHPAQADQILTKVLSDDDVTFYSIETIEHVLGRANYYVQKRQFSDARELIDSLITANPYNLNLLQNKFSLLLKIDEGVAYNYGRLLLSRDLKDDPGLLEYCARAILYNPKLKNPDWDLALAFSDRQQKIGIDSFQIARACIVKAQIYQRQKLLGNAKESFKEAIIYLSGYNDNDKLVQDLRESCKDAIAKLNEKNKL